MTATSVVGLLLFSSVLVVLVQGQAPAYRPYTRRSRGRTGGLIRVAAVQNGHSTEQNGQAENSTTPTPDDDPPQSWQELLGDTNIQDVRDFLPFLTRNGRPVLESDLFVPQETDDGKLVITGGGIMAQHDQCSPRNMSVRLDLDFSDPQVVYFPECTVMERCGGCTPSPYLSCVPQYQERIVLKVIKGRYPYPGARNIEMERFASVEVARHRSCKLSCNLETTGCGPYKTYVPRRCACRCLNFTQCTNNKVWNEDTCRCECPNQVPCCNPAAGPDRYCPLTFDHNHCECTLKQAIAGISNISQAEIEAWLASRTSQPAAGSSHFELPPDTTTPTSTTTAATTPAVICPDFFCPRQFRKVMSASGRCLCQSNRG